MLGGMLYDLESETGFRSKPKLSLSDFGILSALLCA